MITLPMLTEKDLEIFKNKKVIIYGTRNENERMVDILEYFNIEVIGIYSDIWRDCLKKGYKNVPLLKRKSMYNLTKVYNNLIIQYSSITPDTSSKFSIEIKNLNLECSNLYAGQILNSFTTIVYSDYIKNTNNYDLELVKWKNSYRKYNHIKLERLIKQKIKNIFLVCLPMKTGDYTINNTFDFINNKNKKNYDHSNVSIFKDNFPMINDIIKKLIKEVQYRNYTIKYINFFHKPQRINIDYLENKLGKVKIITAIREPISQNLSSLFEELSTGRIYIDWILGDIENLDESERMKIISQKSNLFCKNGNDVQILFNSFIDRYIYAKDNRVKNSKYSYAMQNFMKQFSEYVLDITKYPFNKEKGYTIIKEGNTEVFVYQLEKLNNLVPELSDWMGVSFTELVRGNDASDKWVGDSYKQAQKEIEITQEYFDRCYNEPYVQHCYSQADIEKFKERWRSHIK